MSKECFYKRIDFSQRLDKEIPKRKDFEVASAAKVIDEIISNKESIHFFMHGKPEFINVDNATNLHLYGILPDGSKTIIIIEKVPIYFDVMLPADKTPKQTLADIRRLLTGPIYENGAIKYDIIESFPLKKFQLKPNKYIRLYFNTTYNRDTSISALNGNYLGIQTASDDYHYFNMLARIKRWSTTGWNQISNYRFEHGPKRSNNCTNEFYIKIDAIAPVDDKDLSKLNTIYRAKQLAINPDETAENLNLFFKPKIMVLTLDIETYSWGTQTGEPPKGDEKNYTIFDICMSLHYEYSEKPLAGFTIMDADSKMIKKNDDFSVIYSIKCKDYTNCMSALLEVFRSISPDTIITFNGGHFDWPCIWERCKLLDDIENQKLGIYELYKSLASYDQFRNYFTCERPEDYARRWIKSIILVKNKLEKKCYSDENIKISPDETMKTKIMKFPGVLDYDAMIIFRVENNKDDRYSLNYFLEKYKMPLKKDMPYKTMFDIYEHAIGFQKLNLPFGEKIKPKCDKYTKDEVYDLLGEVDEYCLYDAFSTQRLGRLLASDKREVAKMSFVSLFEGYYRANGMKVTNLVGAYAATPRFNINFSNTRAEDSNDKRKFPGAWVCEPKKGLDRKRPKTGVDFTSLYPSIMMAYNATPDKSTDDEEEAKELERQGYLLEYVEFDMNEEARKDNPSLPTDLVRGWLIRHSGVKEIGQKPFRKFKLNPDGSVMRDSTGSMIPEYEDREPLPGEMMGIFPYIQEDLFNYRVKLKAVLKKLGQVKEKLGKIISALKNREFELDSIPHNLIPKPADFNGTELEGNPITDLSNITLDKIIALLDDVEFHHSMVDSKQKAVKIYMNTFYGSLGNQRSALFKLMIAGAITALGKRNIGIVYNWLLTNQYKVPYGDTDSNYVECPEKIYSDCDKKFKEDIAEITDPAMIEKIIVQYWTGMVQLTRKDINILIIKIEDLLAKNNGTAFLRMAYEEVLFPVYFTGKKKYFGIKHVDEINFYPKKDDYFIKGIDIVKQGETALSKIIGWEFIMECLSPAFTGDPYTLALQKLKDTYARDWETEMFAATKKYKLPKPGKPGNLSVIRFVERHNKKRVEYETEGKNNDILNAYRTLNPGDRFQVVMVEQGIGIDIRGNKLKKSAANSMELLEVFNYHKARGSEMKLNLDYYVDKGIFRLLARFLSYRDEFEPKNTTFKHYKDYDAAVIKNAKKFLETFRNGFLNRDKALDKQIGYNYKRIYKEAVKKRRNEILTNCTTDILNIIPDESVDAIDTAEIKEKIFAVANAQLAPMQEYVKNNIKTKVAKLCKKFGSIFTIRRYYLGKGTKVMESSQLLLIRKVRVIESEINAMIPGLIKELKRDNKNFKDYIDKTRSDLPVGDKYEAINTPMITNEETIKIYKSLDSAINRWVSAKSLHLEYNLLKEELELELSRKTNTTPSVTLDFRQLMESAKFKPIDGL